MNKLILKTITDGIFVPRGIISRFDLVYDSSHNLVELSEYKRGKDLRHDLSQAPNKLPGHLRPIKSNINETFVFLGHFEIEHYGHWLVEGLARFWCLLDQDTSVYRFPVSNTLRAKTQRWWTKTTKAQMLHWKNGPKAFGLLPEQFSYFRNPVQLKEILVPECSMYSLYRISPEHFKVTKAIARYITNDQEPKSDSRPVYLSRGKFSGGNRNTQGEAPIEDYCRDQGYRIAYPEHMSFLEQVEMFNAHDAFVGFAGSAFHSQLLRFVDRPIKCLYFYDDRQHGNIDMIDKMTGAISKYSNCCVKVDHDNKIYKFEPEQAIFAIKNWSLS